MTGSKRTAAALALLLALVMLFSVLYIALEAEHDCCGEGCAVCAQLRICEELLRNLLPAAAVLLAGRLLCAFLCFLWGADFRSARFDTPITLKVKLSN